MIDDGYITFSGSTPVYHYYLKDHQGNNRVVMDANGNIEQVNHYYPFGGLMGDSNNKMTNQNYPSDYKVLSTQPYKYNGKELDRMHGLDWYDYGARHYDAVLGRWMCMDPLEEKYYDVSPYAYCHDNPMNMTDPDGKDDYFNQYGRFLYTRGDGSMIYVQQNKSFVPFQNVDLRPSSNMQLAANIVGHYAEAVGVKYDMNGGKGQVGVSTLHGTDNNGRVLAGTKGGNIYVKETNGHLDPTMYNLYALKGTLRHENEHKKDQNIGLGTSTPLRHIEIILKEMNHSDFLKGSEEYQEGQIGQLESMLKNARIWIRENRLDYNIYSDYFKNAYSTLEEFKHIEEDKIK